MTTITQTITPLPAAPDAATQTPSAYAVTATAFAEALPPLATEQNTLIGQINTVSGEVAANAITAAADAVTASSAATAAENFSNAAEWVSGTTYALGSVVWSPIDFKPYRRIIAGAGTTDPSADATNWTDLATVAPSGIVIADPAGGVITVSTAYAGLIANAAYTLPDLTDKTSFGLAVLENSTAIPSSVTTSDGWTIPTTGLTASTTGLLAPHSTATPHGTWGGGVAMVPPIIATFDASGTAVLQATVGLTATLKILVYTVSTTGIFAVALNTTTNTFGTPASLGTWGNANTITLYRDSDTVFVCGFQETNASVRAGSVSGETITLGTIKATAYPSDVPLVQLVAGNYFQDSGNGQGYAISVTSGTLVTIGTNQAIGTGSGQPYTLRVSDTQVLTVNVASGTSQPLKAAVSTVGAAAYTTGTVVTSAENINGSASLDIMAAFTGNGTFLVGCQAQTPTTSQNFFAITISGTTPTIGAALVRTSTQNLYSPRVTYEYVSPTDSGQEMTAYDATNMLIGYGTEPFALSVSVTTLSEGSGLTGIGASNIVSDALTGLDFFIRGTSTYDRVTVASGTITSVEQIASAPLHISSATLTDKTVSYNGNWYSWNISATRMITPSKWLSVSGATFNLLGEIS